jgi:O-acetyl-ADP-ribose deacetylase (regulator of RNase III)
MTEINYVIGDATTPIGDGHKIIVHVCNNIGAWGSGFVLAISRRWPMPEDAYRVWASNSELNRTRKPFELSQVQMVAVSADIDVANMVAQHKFVSPENPVALRYGALEDCLNQIRDHAQRTNASVHMPRIGCGLAGGDWNVVSGIIEHTLTRHGIEVFVYDLEPS